MSTIIGSTSSYEDSGDANVVVDSGALLDTSAIVDPKGLWPHAPRFDPFYVARANLAERRVYAFPAECVSFWCPNHGPERVGRYLKQWRRLIGDDPLWFAMLPPVDKDEEKKVRKRINEMSRRRHAAKIVVTRIDGTRWVFATANIGGRSITMHPIGLTGTDAWPLIRHATALPGLRVNKPITVSRSWDPAFNPEPEDATWGDVFEEPVEVDHAEPEDDVWIFLARGGKDIGTAIEDRMDGQREEWETIPADAYVSMAYKAARKTRAELDL